jgi:dTDP-4-amino-4,6-dideoxygalactose transaminase
VACFSFHPRKVITTGDGGMLTTSDAALAARFRLLRQHAMSVPDTVRHAAGRIVFEEYLEPAFNHRLTDLQAAVGRPQLARLTAIVEERRRLAERYRRALEGSDVLLPPAPRPRGSHGNHQSYPLRLRPGTGLTQLAAMQHLQDRGIASKRGVSNAHQEPAYRVPGRFACGPTPCGADHTAGRCARLPNSERLRDETILIPLFHGMEAAEQDAVLRALAELTPSTGSTECRSPPVTPRPIAPRSSASPTTSSSGSGSPSAPS